MESTRLLRRSLAATSVLFLACSSWPIPSFGKTPGKEHVAAFTPGTTLDERNVAVSSALHLDPWSIYIFRGEGDRGKRIDTGARRSIAVALSPSGDHIAAEIQSADPGVPGASRRSLLLLDTLSNVLQTFSAVLHSAWSSDGSRLAIVHGLYPPGYEVPVADNVSVWDHRTGIVKRFVEHPYSVEWFGEDSLLLDFYDHTRFLDLRTGRTAQSPYHGSVVSADRSFSLSDYPESDGPRVWDEKRGIDITREIQQLIGGARIRPTPGPFWVSRTDRGSVLCIPTCLYLPPRGPGGRSSIECGTHLVDVQARTLLRSFPGRAIAPSGDRRAAVFLRGTKLQFVDLTEQ